jgi:ABC-type branched-subunit amino acid transport system ATPase component/predicted MFS family arabinose efflux permease
MVGPDIQGVTEMASEMSAGEVDEPTRPDIGAMAVTILDLEAERHAEAEERVLFADELLPGVGDERLTLSQALKIGGTFTFGMVALLTALDELESAALSTLAPDIATSLGISDGLVVFISAASGGFLVLGSVPMGWLADRFARSRIIAIASLVFSAMVMLSGLAVNGLHLFFARLGVGVAKSNQLPVQGSLLADTYPIGTRGRISAGVAVAGRITGTLSPLLVGALAAVAGGTAGWRWAFVILAVPTAIAAVFAFRIPNPPRGQFEKKDILGEVIEDDRLAPISMEAAFARLMQINTIRNTIIAFAAMGFGLFTVPVLSNLFMRDEYDLGSFGRGAVGTVSGVAVLATIPFVGRYYDGLYRRDPARALRLVGFIVLPSAVFTPIQYFMPNAVLFAIFAIPGAVLLSSAFTMVGPILTTVTPYRLRGMGSALGAIYIFFIGATGGSVLSGLLVNAYGPRAAVLLLGIPSTVVGGLLVLRSAGFIKDDLSMIVAEIREELDEHERQKADPEVIPALQVNHIDFSYGPVQILFDVSFEVKRGEVLALLGTNGAGKSTILKAIAGLGTPSRGVVRKDGRNITYVSPEQRTHMGIHLLPGGKGVFSDMTIRENLEMATWNYRDDRDDMERRIDMALDMFPELADRQGELAGSLSGGQQQLLALARVLACEPEILIIDELSLGLAPIMVERLVRAIDDLRATGMTMIIVEQSLNVAVAISDRAVFLEKGQVRFDGPTTELAERGDLARAVFLGKEGG